MKTPWDYTKLSASYLLRPNYSEEAVTAMLRIAEMSPGKVVCDIGAGVGHLSLMLAQKSFPVTAIEPNDDMLKTGEIRCKEAPNIFWKKGTAEATSEPNQVFDLVTFGSSFNVCDRDRALIETSRILRPNGWFACLWNNRDLTDPVQSSIEQIIHKFVPKYDYGVRRQEQTNIINHSGLFQPVIHVNADVIHTQKIEDCLEAWRSHATLKYQAKDKFKSIIEAINAYLQQLDSRIIKIPYRTNIWMAQLNESKR